MKKYKHIRISEDLFLKVQEIASTTFRSIGLTAEMLLRNGVDAFIENTSRIEKNNKERRGGEL